MKSVFKCVYKCTNLNIRCKELYKESYKKEATDLGLTVSEYFHFTNIVALNLQKNYPEFYQQLFAMFVHESEYIR